MQKGGNNINYTYSPSIDSKSAYTVAYEYNFENTMTKAVAINLKSIDTTGVTVSYVYSDSKLDLTSDIEGETTFKLQQLTNKGDEVYIYVLVSPTNVSIPTTFTTSIVWYYGLPQELVIESNNGEVYTTTIVDGQEIDNAILPTPKVEDCYYFDAWFLDKGYTKLAGDTFRLNKGKLYARVANLPEDYINYDSEQQCYYILQGTTTLSGELVIPATYNDDTNGEAEVAYIYSTSSQTLGAFYGQAITSVVFPSTLTSIGNNAFNSATSLTSVNFDSCVNLNDIGTYAFTSTSLVDVVLPNSVTTLSASFEKCTTLTSIKMPTNLTFLQEYCFNGCSSLTSIDLSVCTNLTTINKLTFGNCTSLTSVKLPTDLTALGEYTFYGCTSLKEIDLSPYNQLTSIPAYSFQKSGVIQIKFPHNITNIGIYAFQNCPSLASIDLTNCTQLTSLGTYAFESCVSLTQVDLSDSITTFGAGVFEDTIVKEIVMPSNLTTIDSYTFLNDTSLISADLSKCTKLSTISTSTFSNCPRLVSVKLPNNITTIGEYAFNACWSLSSINIPSNLTTIGTKTFYDCKSITSITLPSTLTSIGTEAFNGCAALAEIYNLSPLTLTSGSNDNGMVAHYTRATNINTSTSVASVIETIGNVIYYKQSSTDYIALAPVNRFGLESLKVDSRTVRINWYAFQYCPNLVSVDLSNCTRMYEISTYGFHNCAKLTTIKLPSSLTSIGTEAFKNCELLATIYNYSSLVLTAGSTSYGYVAYYAKNIY